MWLPLNIGAYSNQFQLKYVHFQFTNVNIDTTCSLSTLSHHQRLCGRLNYQNKSYIIIEIGEIHMQSLETLKSSNIEKHDIGVMSYEKLVMRC